MPIYEYQCGACGHELEKLQRMSDAQLTDCPECGKPKLCRLVSAAGFRLKGAGWYETDFKQGRKKNLHGTHDAAKPKTKPSSDDSTGAGDTKKPASTAASTSTDAA